MWEVRAWGRWGHGGGESMWVGGKGMWVGDLSV